MSIERLAAELTGRRPSSILRMVILGRALVTIAAIVSLSAGNLAVCAGWQPAPAARMACCDDQAACPEHTAGSEHVPPGHSAGTHHTQTQQQADTCCANSEPHESTAAGASFALPGALTLAVTPLPGLLSVLHPPFVSGRALVPLAPSAVPKHLLLSVFLV